MSQKLVKKLADKKYRTETGLFIVEGRKNVLELLKSDFVVETLYLTLEADIDEALHQYQERTKNNPETIIVTEEKLASFGTFQSNNVGVAVAKQRTPLSSEDMLARAKSEYVLVLDDVRDPGNLGTIIRTADWFGITHIVTSETTTDFYNPKTIAGSMGSFTRVHVHSTKLESFLIHAKANNIPSYGAFLTGTSIYKTSFNKNGLVVMGSESHGVSDALASHITHHITIPRHGGAESLNVGIATGLVLNEIRRPS